MSRYSLEFLCCVFFFQAEDGIRDAQESRGLGDVYKRQHQDGGMVGVELERADVVLFTPGAAERLDGRTAVGLSLIHI